VARPIHDLRLLFPIADGRPHLHHGRPDDGDGDKEQQQIVFFRQLEIELELEKPHPDRKNQKISHKDEYNHPYRVVEIRSMGKDNANGL
jgi:hypothetical protein